MSRNTRSSRADRVRALVCALAAEFAITSGASHLNVDAPPLPAAIAALAPGLRPQGGGEMTFFGLSIYDGWYWSGAHAWRPDGIYALDLHYHRSLDGASIADCSVTEIEAIGEIDDPEFTRAFFGIWLDPHTSRPEFRKQLLGAPE